MPADQDTPPSYAPAMVSKETTAEAPKESVSTPVETAGPTPPPKEAPAAPPKDDNAPATPPKDTVVASPATATETPISKLSARLPSITKSVDYSEMWGVQLGNPDSHVPTKVVLQKFLRANNGDVAAAEKQLTAALEWRKKMDPTALAAASYDEAKFGGLGYVTVHKDEASKETVMTWNIYGAVKSFKETFGDIDG